jgi:hypothetical protein
LKKALPLFSYLFHPLFISIYAVLLFFYFSESYFEYQQIYLVIIQIVLVTIFIPLTFYYLLLSYGKVDSIMLDKKSQRKIPLLIHAVLLFVLISKSITLDNLKELHFFFLGSLISTIAAFLLIYAGVKASLHLIGTTALTVFAIGISLHFQIRMLLLIVVLLLLNGVVASSRLVMKAHTNNELFIGSLVGIIPQAVLFYFWV